MSDELPVWLSAMVETAMRLDGNDESWATPTHIIGALAVESNGDVCSDYASDLVGLLVDEIERLRTELDVEAKIRRYISTVLTGSATYDCQLAADECHTEIERLRQELAAAMAALTWACDNLMLGDNKRFAELFPEFRDKVWVPDEAGGAE